MGPVWEANHVWLIFMITGLFTAFPIAFGSLGVALFIPMTIALIGITSARAVFWTIPTRFMTGVGAASGLAFINSIGVAGGYFGPELMGTLKDLTGGYLAGLLTMAGILAASTVLAACLKLLIKLE